MLVVKSCQLRKFAGFLLKRNLFYFHPYNITNKQLITMKTTYVEQIDHFEEITLRSFIEIAEHTANANMAMQENEQVFENLHALTGK